MKRTLAFGTLGLALCLTACGGSNDTSDAAQKSTQKSTPTAEVTQKTSPTPAATLAAKLNCENLAPVGDQNSVTSSPIAENVTCTTGKRSVQIVTFTTARGLKKTKASVKKDIRGSHQAFYLAVGDTWVVTLSVVDTIAPPAAQKTFAKTAARKLGGDVIRMAG